MTACVPRSANRSIVTALPRLLSVGAMTLAMLLSSACVVEGPGQGVRGARAENRTPYDLHFWVYGSDGGRYDGGAVASHDTAVIIGGGSFATKDKLAPTGCTGADVVAEDAQGHLIARHGPGICPGDVWVVTLAGSSPALTPSH